MLYIVMHILLSSVLQSVYRIILPTKHAFQTPYYQKSLWYEGSVKLLHWILLVIVLECVFT